MIIMVCFTLGIFILIFSGDDDSSVILETTRPISNGKDAAQTNESQVSGTVSDLIQNSSNLESQNTQTRPTRKPRVPIKYMAKQVIVRGGESMPDSFIPTGTNLVGKLLTAIDTRESERVYKVLLPYGGNHKSGGAIPKNTILLGKIRYPGKGKKVFMGFSRGVLPDGREFTLSAQALNTADYSPGIEGDFHGKAGARLATTLGLTMVSGMAEAMTQKQAHGANGQETLTPKSSAKNALYHGLSKASELEASRQLGELGREPEYATVAAGIDLIINLTTRINLNEFKNTNRQKN